MIHYMPRDKTRGEGRDGKVARHRDGRMAVWIRPMRIERDAASIASAMAMIHGGEWRVEIDHQHQIVLIRPNVNLQGVRDHAEGDIDVGFREAFDPVQHRQDFRFAADRLSGWPFSTTLS
jgi:hypothetical protein